MAAKRKVNPPRPNLNRPWIELTKAQQNQLYTRALHAYTTGAGKNPSTRLEFFRTQAKAS